MAERFYGEHWAIACSDCGFAFRCGVEHPPDEMLAICPNCGYRENRVDAQAKEPGMAVEVVPRDFAKEPPQRWEVVAYRDDDSDRVHVKRVVGLPGEQLAIRGGDLIVNERRVQKSLADFREVAQIVYDDQFRPRLFWADDGKEDGRIGNPSYDARWRTSGDWLEYHHWSCAATPTPRDADAPLRDNDSYNQGLSRAMNTVGDVMLSFSVEKLSDSDELLVRLYDGDAPLVIALIPEFDEVQIHYDGRVYDSAPAFLPLASSRNWEVAAAVVDGQVLVAVGGVPTLSLNLEADGIGLDPRDVSMAIGDRNMEVQITNLRVLRDVYYLNPLARPDDWEMPAPLGEGEYFLLGDNPPLSRDSRQDGSIAVGRIVGSVQVRGE
jgi:signal peptidase I